MLGRIRIFRTVFHIPHMFPTMGSGLGPGIPWSEKNLNVDVTYLYWNQNLHLEKLKVSMIVTWLTYK